MRLCNQLGIAVLFSAFLSVQDSYGQIITTGDSTCQLTPFVVDDGSMGIHFMGKGGLKAFFSKNLGGGLLEKTGDRLFIQILIDTKGHACCKNISAYNGTVNETVKNEIIAIISRMPKWKPARLNNKLWNASVQIELKLGKGEILAADFIYVEL